MQTFKKNSAIIFTLLTTALLYSPSGMAVEYGTSNNNFTMLDQNGGHVGGTNIVTVNWDGTLNNDVGTAVTNMTMASTIPFQGGIWYTQQIRVYGPGTYTFNPCPDPVDSKGVAADGSINCTSGATLTMTVGPNQIGAHMLFNYSKYVNIDVINVWDMNKIWRYAPNAGTSYEIAAHDVGDASVAGSQCILDGLNADPTTKACVEFLATKWFLSAIDADGDGIPGAAMVDGPFPGFHAIFNIQPQMIYDDTLTTQINTAATTANLLSNDQLPKTLSTGNFTISAFDATTAQGGSVRNNGDNTFTYTPPVNFTGTDSFTYTVNDGVDHSEAAVGAGGHYSATATVNIEVTAATTATTGNSKSSNTNSTTANLTDAAAAAAAAGSLLVLPLLFVFAIPLRLAGRSKKKPAVL